MKSLAVYVVTHKKNYIPNIDGYFPLLVGASKNEYASEFSVRDDMGENISEKNPYYAELTGLYWLWKNSSNDIVGLCHYRRFFSRSCCKTNERFYLTKSEIEKYIDKYDVIMPKKTYLFKSIYDSANVAPSREDYDELRTAIKIVCPEYISDYDKFLKNNSVSLFNMIITRKDILDKYCAWIFELLGYIEKNHNMEKETGYRIRMVAFWAERLLNVWILHNIPIEKVKEIDVIRTDVNAVGQLWKVIKNKIRKVLTRSRFTR